MAGMQREEDEVDKLERFPGMGKVCVLKALYVGGKIKTKQVKKLI